MNKIDEQFIKEKINPVVGFIFHTARQLGQDNAPASMDMQYLKQGTEKVCELLRESPTAPPAESVEDALECLEGFGIRLAVEAKSTATKSLRARQCEIRSKAIFTVLDAFRTLEQEREQCAAKHCVPLGG